MAVNDPAPTLGSLLTFFLKPLRLEEKSPHPSGDPSTNFGREKNRDIYLRTASHFLSRGPWSDGSTADSAGAGGAGSAVRAGGGGTLSPRARGMAPGTFLGRLPFVEGGGFFSSRSGAFPRSADANIIDSMASDGDAATCRAGGGGSEAG